MKKIIKLTAITIIVIIIILFVTLSSCTSTRPTAKRYTETYKIKYEQPYSNHNGAIERRK